MTLEIPNVRKPLLRGASHRAAFYVTLGAGSMLVATCTNSLAVWATLVYVVSLASLFGISALYHCPDWPQRIRQRLRRFDHAAIYFLIAGSYTPVCLLALNASGHSLLLWIWLGSGIGIIKSLWWPGAPKPLNAALFLLLGWLGVLKVAEIATKTNPMVFSLLMASAGLYSIGALVYALRRPDPIPRVFGYHEVFHGLVILAVICHFIGVMLIIRAHP